MLNPDFPVVQGQYQMTEEWSVKLPGKFNRRFEEGCLVLWRPGFTIWVSVWGNDHNESPQARLEWLESEVPQDAFGVLNEHEGDVLRLAYRLDEPADDERAAAFYGFAIGSSGHVQMAVYFDEEEQFETARQVWRSLWERLPTQTART